MLRRLVPEETKVLCHQVYCSYLARKWPFYGRVVEFVQANTGLILAESEIEKQVRDHLNIKLGWLGFQELEAILKKNKDLQNTTITASGLFDLTVHVCMTHSDHTKAPNSNPGGGKQCP